VSGLDYINSCEKIAKILTQVVPTITMYVDDRLSHKNLNCEFDSELIDLVEISDMLNGDG